jgi:hypothetical protein
VKIERYSHHFIGEGSMDLSDDEAKLNPANRKELFFKLLYRTTKTPEELNQCIDDILPPIEKIHQCLHHLYELYAIDRPDNKLTMQHNGIEWKVSMFTEIDTMYVHANFFASDRKVLNIEGKQLKPINDEKDNKNNSVGASLEERV